MREKLVDKLMATDRTLVSFELLPPLKGDTIDTIYKTLDPLMEFNPPYVNMTYHREEVVYKAVSNKLVERRTIRKRPGTVAISAAIKYKYKVEVVPHLICGAFSKTETEDALIDLNFLDISNVLAVRGDPEKGSKVFIPEEDGHAHAIDLVRQIMDMNRGQYLDEDLVNATPTDFSVGVAGYPEKHPEAPNMQSDMYFLKKKVEAGAEFIVTQMFFDNTRFFRFVEACRQEGIRVPIIPGLKPVATRNHLNYLPKTFGIDLPDALVREVIRCKDNDAVRQVGIEWGIQQSRELKTAGVPVVHYYTMGRSDNIRKIVEAVF